jgi:hypothetical protein
LCGDEADDGPKPRPKIFSIMRLTSPNCVDHDVNFMIDEILEG